MKFLRLLIAASAPLFLLVACGGNDSHDSGSSSSSGDSDPSDKHPKIGMTQSQVRDMYGDPDSVDHSAQGDIWHYWFNKGSMFIPYNYGYHSRTGTFFFDQSGVLKDYNYNE